MMSIKGYSIATIEEFVGRELGVSDWVVVDQARIDAFARVHRRHAVDPRRTWSARSAKVRSAARSRTAI